MRYSVCSAIAGLAVVSAGCSDATPTAIRAYPAALAVTTTALPYVAGARVTRLTGIESSFYFPLAMNDWGEVVGYDQPRGLDVQGWKWQATRGLRYIPAPIDTIGFASVGVNDSGQVAVWVDPGGVGGLERAAIWGWFGQLDILRDLSSYQKPGQFPSCKPFSINDRGIVAGICHMITNPNSLATVWTASGTPWAIRPNDTGPTIAITDSWVYIADSNYISGQTIDLNAFVFTPTKQLVVLPKVRYAGHTVTSTESRGVNNRGQVTGFAAVQGDTACVTHAIAWFTPALATDLGFCGEPFGITDDSIVVASLGNHPTFVARAAIWTPRSGLQLLPGLETGAALAKETSTVIYVNHKHQILGTIVTSDGIQHNVMWTVPSQ